MEDRSAGPSGHEFEEQGANADRAKWPRTFATSQDANEQKKEAERASAHRDPLVLQERPPRPHFYMDDDGEDDRMSGEEEDEFEVPATPPDERGAFG